MLPGMGGFEALHSPRGSEKTAEIPVILLTAKDAEQERIRGLELGADDYITKPFSPREVVLRAQAVLRRVRAEALASSRRLKAGPIELDLEAHRAFASGVEIDLAPLEYRVLETLLERRGRVQTRRKLGEAGAMIETVRGIGYRLRTGH